MRTVTASTISVPGSLTSAVLHPGRFHVGGHLRLRLEGVRRVVRLRIFNVDFDVADFLANSVGSVDSKLVSSGLIARHRALSVPTDV